MFNEGFLVIDKPEKISNEEIAKAIINIIKPKKIDYTKNLGFEDSGLIIFCFGIASALVDYINKQKKEYIITIKFGATSNTFDYNGIITENDDAEEFTDKELKAILSDFVGQIIQKPLLYSPLKSRNAIRKSVDIDTNNKIILIDEIELVELSYPIAKIRVKADSAISPSILAKDIGNKIGKGGYLEKLRMIGMGEIDLDLSMPLENVNYKSLISVQSFPFLPKLDLCEDDLRLIYRGMLIRRSNKFNDKALFSGFYRGKLIAVLEYIKEKMMFRPIQVFNN